MCPGEAKSKAEQEVRRFERSLSPHRWLAGAGTPSAMSEGPRRMLGDWQQAEPLPELAAVKDIFHSLSGPITFLLS